MSPTSDHEHQRHTAPGRLTGTATTSATRAITSATSEQHDEHQAERPGTGHPRRTPARPVLSPAGLDLADPASFAIGATCSALTPSGTGRPSSTTPSGHTSPGPSPSGSPNRTTGTSAVVDHERQA